MHRAVCLQAAAILRLVREAVFIGAADAARNLGAQRAGPAVAIVVAQVDAMTEIAGAVAAFVILNAQSTCGSARGAATGSIHC